MGAAVHEEILRCAEPAVTDVPAQDTQILSGDRTGARAFYVHGFNRFGLILRSAQKGQQTPQRKDDDQQQDQQDLQQLFHPGPSVSWYYTMIILSFRAVSKEYSLILPIVRPRQTRYNTLTILKADGGRFP